MLVFFILSSIITLSQQQQFAIKVIKSGGALQYRTLESYVFKGIPKLSPLGNNEKREIYHYEQIVVIRDSGLDDAVHRCEMVEVYKAEEVKPTLEQLSSALKSKVNELDMVKIMSVMSDCDSLDNKKASDPSENPNQKPAEKNPKENPLLHGVVPGTNWCGFGDIAHAYRDLGRFRNVDRCCRSHDFCPIKILSKDVRYNITNTAIYTKSHCMCDDALYKCLKNDNGWTAKLIGRLYFSVTKPQCVKGLPEVPGTKMTLVPTEKKW